MSRRNHDFQTIRSEGGLLPPDLLRRVLDPTAKLDGTRPEEYGLPQGERLNEVITQSWNRLRKHWGEFRAATFNLPEGEPATGLTNDKWNLPLLRELGFGLLPTSAGPEVGGRTYAINRFFGPVPIHLVGCGLSLDRRAAGVRGAAAINPHGLVQEFVNRSPGHRWAVVSNGLRFRILRDNQALSRQSFLEFDLEAMFAGEVFSDFVLLWLIAHATRFNPREAERPETCWLEEWTKLAEEQGTRALGDLRGGVEKALEILGEGFTSHPKNTRLRDALRSGQLKLANFHGQLLRVVYRLIFLFVAEDRTLDGQPLLHPRDNSDAARSARERYSAHYGTARLRDLAAKIKGSRHGDLWRQFQLLLGALSGDAKFAAAREHLALPALGSFLWDPASTAAVNDADLTNHDCLEALRHLAFTRQGKVLRPVDYRNLGAEELGGLYESLLALTPQVSADGARFTFAEFAGNERKTSGSYYTPDSLVQSLLDSALDPVVDEAIKGKTSTDAEKAILALKICDPAVGSGHFLVGAAHRLARNLARVRALAQGESESSPLLYQHALRDVIGRCLYGVDINPMAAELCRVGLWLEALEPGKPLSFLDHHIRVGNSLLGATPQLIAAGLPDETFVAIEGDDKKVCAALKKRNQQEREGQQDMLHLMVAEPSAEYNSIETRTRRIDEAPDNTIDEIRHKCEQFRRLVVSSEYRRAQHVADAWCAAFVWVKQAGALSEPITTDTLRRLEVDPQAFTSAQHAEVERLAGQYQFFHWHLAFPEVLANGGFDCVLGNPPWERVKIQEKEWFAERSPEIANARNAAARTRLILDLKTRDPLLHQQYLVDSRTAEGEGHVLRHGGAYPLCGCGDVNTYAVFAELILKLINSRGRMACILPLGIATDDTTKEFFRALVAKKTLVSVLGFINERMLFPQVLHNFKFCILAASGAANPFPARFVFNCYSVDETNDPERQFTLSSEEILKLNPETGTCSTFFFRKSAELTLAIYRRLPIVASREAQFSVELSAMLHMGEASSLFRTAPEPGFLPVYESKMIHQFNHRFASFHLLAEGARSHMLPETPAALLADPAFVPSPCYWIPEYEVVTGLRESYKTRWLIASRRITSAGLQRTSIYAIIPLGGASDSITLALLPSMSVTIQSSFVANMNSFACDFVTRQKQAGANLSFFVIRQLPIVSAAAYAEGPSWSANEPLSTWITQRVLELSYTAWDLEPFAQDGGWSGPPFCWDEERRFLLRCELDSAFFYLYLPAEKGGDWRPAEGETAEDLTRLRANFPTPRDAVAYIMDTFPIVRRKDEEKYAGDYRTKRVILEIYDAMAEAIRTGQPYQSRVDPLPGPPMDAAGTMMSMYQLDRGDWPPHLHPPHPDWEESLLAAWFGIRKRKWKYFEDEQIFPWDGREAFAYALIPYLVHEKPGKHFEFYRDAALLASCPKHCETLLLEDGLRESYGQVMRGLDWLQFPDAHRIRPLRIREALQGRKVVQTDASSGVTTPSSAASLPPLPAELKPLMALIFRAVDNLERVQRDALERAEAAMLSVKKENLTKDLGALLVA